MKVQHTVTLLHSVPLYLAAYGARTCWDSGDKSDTVTHYDPDTQSYYAVCGTNDAALIDRVGNKFRHASILEHLNYTFYIEGISRACLQELSRHRHASPSVKSTRYTLKELKDEVTFITNTAEAFKEAYERASKYLVWSEVEVVDAASLQALENLRAIIALGVSNDKAKYCLPESYKVTEQLTINARSLQNFLYLRSDKSALWEIRQLAHSLYDALPEDHKYLYVDHIKSKGEE